MLLLLCLALFFIFPIFYAFITSLKTRVLAESPIGVTVRSKREHIENGTYPPRFKLALARKDMRLVTDTATHAGAALRLAAAARTWFEEAADQDLGKLDYSAVIAHIRGRAARLSERSS